MAAVDAAPLPRSRPQDLIPADLAEWEEEGSMAPIPRQRPEAPRVIARLIEPEVVETDDGPDESEAERLRTLINAPIPRARPAVRQGGAGSRQTVAAPTRRTLMGLPPADLDLNHESEGLQAAVLRQMPAPLVVPPGARRLSLYNVNTLETFDDVYWQDGRYVPAAMRKLRSFMRDYRANASRDMDPRLYDLLHSIAHKAGSREPFKVISAYRSARTNASRARRSRGVAKNSYHVKGMAIDIALPGYSLRGLQTVALSMSAGGVGYYSRSGFVHVDVGPVRTW
ncbi:DUF882 domain-containing protein [Zavarzinia sp. CC-PAN008]|uniref:DUF882 domain-containing protein n=1 Tax=Zavarzinia sp. CC-PAN008 TaxID=3243332 RepID=UPI003F7493CA